MRSLNLGEYAKRSTRSPFREDRNPSWGIFERGGKWCWKDFSTGETGDEISFIARVKGWDSRRDFIECLKLWTAISGQPWRTFDCGPRIYSPRTAEKPTQPDRKPEPAILESFNQGAPQQIASLSALRGIPPEPLTIAQEAGFLRFGSFRGHECFGVTDCTKRAFEIRRLDGKLFPDGGGGHKSHSVAGSQKKWPLGITEAKEFACIALVEGLPDFLSAFALRWLESADARVAPVAMLGASSQIHPEALPLFKGKRVRVFPHADKPGALAAHKWHKQLRPLVARIDYFDFVKFGSIHGQQVKDLNELLLLTLDNSKNRPALLSF